jgi:hypothetical protein
MSLPLPGQAKFAHDKHDRIPLREARSNAFGIATSVLISFSQVEIKFIAPSAVAQRSDWLLAKCRRNCVRDCRDRIWLMFEGEQETLRISQSLANLGYSDRQREKLKSEA